MPPLSGTIWGDHVFADNFWAANVWASAGGGGDVDPPYEIDDPPPYITGEAMCQPSPYPRYRIWRGERWSKWKRKGYDLYCP